MSTKDKDGRANTTVSVNEIIPEIMGTLKRLEEKSRIHRLAVEKFAMRRTQRIKCPNGSEDWHVLDMDASSRESWRTGKLTAVYADCRLCRERGQSDWLHRIGVPKNLLHATLHNWEARNEQDRRGLLVAQRFAEVGKGFLIITGPVGIGKSHLAVAVMRQRQCGRLLTQNRLILKLRDRYRDHFAEDVIERCKSARFLVLDEFGMMTGAKDELPALYEIIDYRHGEEMPTVLTTNIRVDQFAEAFGDRIADRLRCHQPFVELNGESRRGE